MRPKLAPSLSKLACVRARPQRPKHPEPGLSEQKVLMMPDPLPTAGTLTCAPPGPAKNHEGPVIQHDFYYVSLFSWIRARIGRNRRTSGLFRAECVPKSDEMAQIWPNPGALRSRSHESGHPPDNLGQNSGPSRSTSPQVGRNSGQLRPPYVGHPLLAQPTLTLGEVFARLHVTSAKFRGDVAGEMATRLKRT